MEHLHGRPLELNKGRDWPEDSVDDLRGMLAAGDTLEDVAEFLCRPVEEIRIKTIELKLLPAQPN